MALARSITVFASISLKYQNSHARLIYLSVVLALSVKRKLDPQGLTVYKAWVGLYTGVKNALSEHNL